MQMNVLQGRHRVNLSEQTNEQCDVTGHSLIVDDEADAHPADVFLQSLQHQSRQLRVRSAVHDYELVPGVDDRFDAGVSHSVLQLDAHFLLLDTPGRCKRVR